MAGEHRTAVGLLTEEVRSLPALPGLPAPHHWSRQKVLTTETDVTVAVFGTAREGPLIVGRVVGPGGDGSSLRRNDEVLATLRSDSRLLRLAPLLPEPLAVGDHRGRTYAFERAVVGFPALRRTRGYEAVHRFLDGTATAISELHRLTGARGLIDERWLDRWVGGPVDVMRRACSVGGATDGMLRLGSELRESLGGRRCCTAWTHGDLWAGNVLLDERGERLVGIVDWDGARPDGLPVVDLLHLLLTTRAEVEGIHLGEAVNELLDGRPWSAPERRVLVKADWALPSTLEHERATILLAWLGHVAAVLKKRPRNEPDRRWLERNVTAVLSRFQ